MTAERGCGGGDPLRPLSVLKPGRHWLDLPSLSPAGGLCLLRGGVEVAFRYPAGACLLCRLPTMPLALFLPPIPPPRARRALFPGGEGGFLGYFMQGAPPLASPGFNPRGAYRTCPNGCPVAEIRGSPPKRQETLSFEQCRQPRREGDRGRWTYPSLTRRRRLRWSSPPGQGKQVPPGACPGDARGEAPCIRKLKSPPSPEGKGGGGMGAESKTKGKVGGRPTGHAPRRAPVRQEL